MHRSSPTWVLSLPLVLAAFAVPSGIASAAPYIPVNLDRAGLRTKMAGEGYLSYHLLGSQDRIFPAGEERSGWIDQRAPWYFNGGDGNANNILTKDLRLGYDRSDRQITVNNTIITHTANGAGVANQTAAPNIARDFNYANQIYQQIGISVVSESIGTANVAVPNQLAQPPAASAAGLFDSDRVLGANRSANARTVNNAYVVNYTGADPVGFAISPEDTIGANVRPNSGVIVTNSAAPDSFAHELGHFVLDQYRFAGNSVHSTAVTDMMRNGFDRQGAGATPKSATNDAPRQAGETNGNLGGRDRFAANMTLPGDPTPPPGGYKQATAVYNAEKDGNRYVQVANDNNSSVTDSGDRADFDFVEDSYRLEDIAGFADNHPGARDALYFQKGLNTSPFHGGHEHGNWGSLDRDGFDKDFFRYADVISLIARYSDMDTDDAGDWSPRESALDYFVEFSADGNAWTIGSVTDVFTEGWTIASDADNYTARWLSPFDAKYLRVTALEAGFFGHDGNTQIDAVIVAPIPEPTLLALALPTALPLLRRRRQRHQRHSA